MVAGPQQPEQRINSRHARGEYVCRLAAFQARHATLQGPPVGVRRARIVVAFILSQRFLDISRSLINWRDNRPGGRFRLLSYVNRVGRESHLRPPPLPGLAKPAATGFGCTICFAGV